MKLENKTAVVTGGSTGIGFATARRFVAEGARVTITGRTRKTLDTAVAELGDRASSFEGDVSKLGDLDALFESFRARGDEIDVLFVNAGIAPFVPFEQASEEHFDEVIGVNLKGAYFTIQKALPVLRRGASIVLTSSVANRVGYPSMSVYAASKAALRSLARTLSTELAPRGIRVNTLSPGMIETPLIGKLGLSETELDGFNLAIMQQVPMRRPGQADEMASAALFLASSESSYVVGSELIADGGLTQV